MLFQCKLGLNAAFHETKNSYSGTPLIWPPTWVTTLFYWGAKRMWPRSGLLAWCYWVWHWPVATYHPSLLLSTNSTTNRAENCKRGKIGGVSHIMMTFDFVPDWLTRQHLCCDWLERIARALWTNHKAQRTQTQQANNDFWRSLKIPYKAVV